MKIFKEINNKQFLLEPILADSVIIWRDGLEEIKIKKGNGIEIWVHFSTNIKDEFKALKLDINTISNIDGKITRNKFYYSDMEIDNIQAIELIIQGEKYLINKND